MPSPIPPKAFTTGEVAKLCHVNLRTVIRWIERGELRAYQLPGRGDNRIEPEALIEFLTRHKIPVPESLKPAKPSILIVDDDELLVKALVRVLQPLNADLITASDGFKAGMLLATHTPSLMLIDLQMPGMSGLEVIQLVREMDRLKHIKILVLSAQPMEILKRTLDAGADAVLEKPYDRTVLIETVEQLISIS